MRVYRIASVLLLAALSIAALSGDASAQTGVFGAPAITDTQVFTATGAKGAIYEKELGIGYHKIQWYISGTVSTCQLKLEKSPDNSTQTDLIANQTCTSEGSSLLTEGTGSWVRLNLGTFSGGGTLTVVYSGYKTNAASSSTFSAAATPATNDGAALGSSSLSWSDLFLASGGVINWANGNFTLTHSSGTLTASGNLRSSLVNGATAVLWEQHDPTILGTVGTAAGNVGGYKLGFNYQPARWTNGTIGEPNYIDDVWRIGSNIGALSGNRADTAKASLGLTWESKFINDGGLVFQHEFHLEGVTTDGLTAYRPISFAVTHDASIIGGSFTADYLNFASKDGTQMVKFDWQSGNKIINVNQSIKLAFTNNNVPLFTQRNAATNAFLNLPYIDAGDVLVGAQPMYVTGARAGAAATYPGSFVTFQPTSANTNDIMVRLQGLSVTGNHKGISANTTASALFQQEFVNQGAGVSEIYVGVEGAGDPRIQFNDLTGRFVMGIDNSASHIFKISTGSALGTGDVMTLDSSGNMTIIGLKTTGSAGSKSVVCVDTSTGVLYASSSGVACAN